MPQIPLIRIQCLQVAQELLEMRDIDLAKAIRSRDDAWNALKESRKKESKEKKEAERAERAAALKVVLEKGCLVCSKQEASSWVVRRRDNVGYAPR